MTGLDDYRPLGRSGLRVSPLALGAMTFGGFDFCSDDDTSRKVYRTYREAGGNFVDTADNYSDGRSEELVGEFLRESGDRDDVVLATKYSGPRFADGKPVSDARHRSNGRKNMIASLERSLRRLGVDHVDLYWLHIWDGDTPAEEVVSAFDDLVRAGKIRAAGISDAPAWFVTKAAMLGAPIAAMQLEYSLIERSIETEHVPLAREFGIAVQPWGAIGGGFLSGKYTREGARTTGSGRLTLREPDRTDDDRRWAVVDAVRAVATEIGATPAQVAMHWVTRQPEVMGTLAGAKSPEQLLDTAGALDLSIPQAQLDHLTAVSAPELPFPHSILARLNADL